MKKLLSAGPWILLAFTCALGWLFKRHCGDAWTGSIQYVTGCYSDIVPFWGVRGVSTGEIPYLQARMEYPVLTGGLIWLEGWIARLLGGYGARATDLLNVAAWVNAGLAFGVLAMMRRMHVPLPRQYAWAGAPVLILYLGHNWDMLAVAFAMGAVMLASRGRDTAAAGLAALGASAKLFPVVFLPILGIAALARPGPPAARIAHAARLVLVAVVAWAAVNLPVMVLAYDNWAEFYRFSSQRGGTAGATWDNVANAGLWRSAIPARNIASAISFTLGATAILGLGWRRHAGRHWALFTPVLAWFMLTSKVWSPQFDLWLFPFLLLTCASPTAIAAFALADVCAYFAEFWMFASMDGAMQGWTQDRVMYAAIARGAVMLWIVVQATRGVAPEWMRGDPSRT